MLANRAREGAHSNHVLRSRDQSGVSAETSEDCMPAEGVGCDVNECGVRPAHRYWRQNWRAMTGGRRSFATRRSCWLKVGLKSWASLARNSVECSPDVSSAGRPLV